MESEESKGATDCGFEGRQGLQGAKKDALKTRLRKGEGNAEETGWCGP